MPYASICFDVKLTDMNEWLNPDEAEFDPARRRRRHGRMPAGLRRYWAARGRKFDPARRHRRHRVRHIVYDRRRRKHRGRRHLFDPVRRFHRRRYDFGRSGGWLNAASDPMTTAAGGMFHNFLVQKIGLGSGQFHFPIGGARITQLGAVAGVISIVGKKFGWFGPTLHQFLNGMFSEGFNIPAIENVARPSSGAIGGSGGGNAGGYGAIPNFSGLSVSNSNYPDLVNIVANEPAMGVMSPQPVSSPAISPSYVPVWGYT